MFNGSLRLTAATMNNARGRRNLDLHSQQTPCDDNLNFEPSANGIGVIATPGSIVPQSVTTVRVLGHGRAAEARLVRVKLASEQSSIDPKLIDRSDADADDAHNTLLCVEKVFHPGLLTRLIYRASFQAPFAYQSNSDAILASFYRRRVAASIIRAMIPAARVAVPLYVRWDQQTCAMVLASEFIRGRGIVPAPTDSWMIRRRLAGLLGRSEKVAPPPSEEIDELLQLMTQLESLLIQCGLTGSGWQVCKRAMVSTANLLRTENGYVVVDLESGIPSVLVPHYVRAGLRLGSIPLFDDLDPSQLRNWIGDHRRQLSDKLTHADLEQLDDDVERLIRHTAAWKLSELAIGRHPRRLLNSDFRSRLKATILKDWQRREIVDQHSAHSLRDGARFFTGLTFLLGLIPGKIGRFFQRLWANEPYRRQVSRYFSDAADRKETNQRFATTKSNAWRCAGRIGERNVYHSVSVPFLANWLLSKVTPAVAHRLVADRDYRRNRLLRMFLFCVSGRFQSDFGRLLIQSRIERWRASERLTDAEADSLHRQIRSAAVDEYVRCFGLHVGLKLLLPVVMSLKLGGAAASVASGNPAYFLFMLMLLPMLRTAVTLWRMTASGHPASDYRDALLVGVIPVVGSLAYPVQMHAKFSGLSMFLLRDFAARVGCWLPIYGGKDSRTELAAIKSVNVLAEALALWLAATVSARTEADEIISEQLSLERMDATAKSARGGRWDHLAKTQIGLIAVEIGLTRSQLQGAQEHRGLAPVVHVQSARHAA
jgi:hypothetical protein